MSIYLFDLPTTGAISFSDFCTDRSPTKSYTSAIADATQARANLRTGLKESKRTEQGQKDYLKLVKIIDEYIPHLLGILACVAHDEINLLQDPVFSWRTTLSAPSLLHTDGTRLSIPSLQAEYAFTLLTYAFTLSNLARTTLTALGKNYERDPSITDLERKAKDDKLNFAVTLLCRAAGVFAYLSESVLVDWDQLSATGTTRTSTSRRPVDVSRELTAALSKSSLATAQALAIRKLLSKSAFDNTISPGPPLPKSHPSPALIAKLHLECAALYASARSLAKTPASSSSSSSASSSKRIPFNNNESATSADVHPDLRKYLATESALHSAVAHKWLGVDGGETATSSSPSPGSSSSVGRCGEGVAFLLWAKKELEGIKFGGDDGGGGGGGGGSRKKAEVESVDAFLSGYRRLNDSITFQPVPPQSELSSRIPAGRLAVAIKPYTPPRNAFGPGSASYTGGTPHRLDDGLGEGEREEQRTDAVVEMGRYAGAGSYF